MHDAVHELCLKKDEDIELLSLFNSDFYSEKEINVSLKSLTCVELIVELILFKKKTKNNKQNKQH